MITIISQFENHFLSTCSGVVYQTYHLLFTPSSPFPFFKLLSLQIVYFCFVQTCPFPKVNFTTSIPATTHFFWGLASTHILPVSKGLLGHDGSEIGDVGDGDCEQLLHKEGGFSRTGSNRVAARAKLTLKRPERETRGTCVELYEIVAFYL